jgi:hypothetical protein
MLTTDLRGDGEIGSFVLDDSVIVCGTVPPSETAAGFCVNEQAVRSVASKQTGYDEMCITKAFKAGSLHSNAQHISLNSLHRDYNNVSIL